MIHSTRKLVNKKNLNNARPVLSRDSTIVFITSAFIILTEFERRTVSCTVRVFLSKGTLTYSTARENDKSKIIVSRPLDKAKRKDNLTVP